MKEPLEGQLELPFVFEDKGDSLDLDQTVNDQSPPNEETFKIIDKQSERTTEEPEAGRAALGRLSEKGHEAAHIPEISVQRQVARKAFPTKWVAGLIQKARKVVTITSEPPQGWTKSSVDLKGFLAVFKSLNVKEGMMLRAYQWRSGGNGYGVVCAMPQDLPFPEPDECEVRSGDYPKSSILLPQGALNNPMEAIEGDHSMWSYMEASMFARELGEIGAMWHGMKWRAHILLDRGCICNLRRPKDVRSLEDFFKPGDLNPDDWDWVEPQPVEWRATVTKGESAVRVVFYSYSGLGNHRIYRHVDEYRVGNYCPQCKCVEIAKCAGGFLF